MHGTSGVGNARYICQQSWRFFHISFVCLWLQEASWAFQLYLHVVHWFFASISTIRSAFAVGEGFVMQLSNFQYHMFCTYSDKTSRYQKFFLGKIASKRQNSYTDNFIATKYSVMGNICHHFSIIDSMHFPYVHALPIQSKIAEHLYSL